MSRLRLWITATAVWFFVFYNVERLQGAIDIASFVYGYAAVITTLSICVRPLQRVSAILQLAVYSLGFIAIKYSLGYELIGPALPLTITEICSIGLTLYLSRGVAEAILLMEDSTADAALVQLDNQLASFETGQAELYREIRRARQYQRPLALVAIGPTNQSVNQSLHRFVEEVHHKAIERYIHARVAEVLSKECSQCDLIARRNNHFVMVLPETDQGGASTVAQRLKSSIEAKLGLAVHTGTACFPGQEVTFTGLLERAEAEMQGHTLRLVGG